MRPPGLPLAGVRTDGWQVKCTEASSNTHGSLTFEGKSLLQVSRRGAVNEPAGDQTEAGPQKAAGWGAVPPSLWCLDGAFLGRVLLGEALHTLGPEGLWGPGEAMDGYQLGAPVGGRRESLGTVGWPSLKWAV